MSTILKILVPAVPPHNADAYAYADALALSSADLPPNPRLMQFHDALVERYPCWSSGAYPESAGRLRCPWTETPLASSFRGDMGIIGVTSLNPEVVPFVLRRAGAFALTVIDQQGGRVYRPATFCVAFTGVQKNVNTNAMVAKLMPLLKASREQVLKAISTPNILLKCRLDYVTAKRFVATMDLIGCNCTIEKEVLVPVADGAAAGAALLAAVGAASPASVAARRMATSATSAARMAEPSGETGSGTGGDTDGDTAPASAPVTLAPAPVTAVPDGAPAVTAHYFPPNAAGSVAPAIAPPVLETAVLDSVSLGASAANSSAEAAGEQPLAPTTTATARLAMARFEIAEPDGRRPRGSDAPAASSWLSRVLRRGA